MDESTDIGSVKTMCIVTRFFDVSVGLVVSKFLELVNVFGADLSENIEVVSTAANLYIILTALEKMAYQGIMSLDLPRTSVYYDGVK